MASNLPSIASNLPLISSIEVWIGTKLSVTACVIASKSAWLTYKKGDNCSYSQKMRGITLKSIGL